MAFRHEESDTLLVFIFEGEITATDLFAVSRVLSRREDDVAFVPDRLTDLSGIRVKPGATVEFITEIALKRRRKVFVNSFRSAIVAPTPAALGYAHMFQTLNRNPQIEIAIFSTRHDAELWLRPAAVLFGEDGR